MRKLGVLNGDNVPISYKSINRKVVRGICPANGKVLMIYSDKYENYSFPGGGMKVFESAEECLKREIKEETGMVVKTISKPIGYIDEVKKKSNDSNFIQRTSYYFCTIESIGKPHPENHEKNYEIRFIDINEALDANEKANIDLTFIERERLILRVLKEEYDERIRNS